MRLGLWVGLSLVGLEAFAGGTISSVEVTGNDSAELKLVGYVSSESPRLKQTDNVIEFDLPDAQLSDSLHGRLDIDNPHTLVRRMSLYPAQGAGVHARLVVNGTLEGIKNRVQFSQSGGNLAFSIQYPKAENATLNLLKEEQAPIKALQETKTVSNRPSPASLAVVVAVIFLAGIVTYLVVRVMKTKGRWQGSRKHLVEQLGYCALGPKTGVSLLRVGREFVLVGVTPNQVSMLSNLPRLQEQYDEETQFERGVFKEAIREEAGRV